MIVGAGLAGCTLARRLEQAGQSFQLIGSSRLPAAFQVAAGIINPVTGRWMTKSWRFDDFAHEAARFYRAIERDFSIEAYHPIPEVRFCLHADDTKRARRRIRNPRYAKVLGDYTPPGESHPTIRNPHGSFTILGAAYVELHQVVGALRRHYAGQGKLRDASFDYGKLSPGADVWIYEGLAYERVIFCEGASLKQNPWFGHLPITPAKGETLLCNCPELELPQQLLHHQKWLLPYPNGQFRMGATYDESDLSEAPTEAGAKELLDGFHALTADPHEAEVIRHLAGIRPSTHDARPFLGQHPDCPGLYIFNGLGSKGASLAPGLSRELLEYILEGKALDREADIQRFT